MRVCVSDIVREFAQLSIFQARWQPRLSRKLSPETFPRTIRDFREGLGQLKGFLLGQIGLEKIFAISCN